MWLGYIYVFDLKYLSFWSQRLKYFCPELPTSLGDWDGIRFLSDGSRDFSDGSRLGKGQASDFNWMGIGSETDAHPFFNPCFPDVNNNKRIL